MSLYHVLGVAPDASAQALRQAYETAVLALPRGKTGRVLAWLRGRSARHLAQAYAVLNQPEQRERYDRELASNRAQAQVGPGH